MGLFGKKKTEQQIYQEKEEERIEKQQIKIKKERNKKQKAKCNFFYYEEDYNGCQLQDEDCECDFENCIFMKMLNKTNGDE